MNTRSVNWFWPHSRIGNALLGGLLSVALFTILIVPPFDALINVMIWYGIAIGLRAIWLWTAYGIARPVFRSQKSPLGASMKSDKELAQELRRAREIFEEPIAPRAYSADAPPTPAWTGYRWLLVWPIASLIVLSALIGVSTLSGWLIAGAGRSVPTPPAAKETWSSHPQLRGLDSLRGLDGLSGYPSRRNHETTATRADIERMERDLKALRDDAERRRRDEAYSSWKLGR